ncbi:MAG: RsiV family protein [Sporosarcina sp.]
MKRLSKLKEDHHKIEIPSGLEDVVKSTIRQAKTERNKRPLLKQWSIGVAAAAVLFVGSINLSPSLAQAMANVPVLGPIIEVFTVQQLNVDGENFQANVASPAIEGLADKGLQTTLNDKYIAESQAKFTEFEKEMAKLRAAGGGNFSLNSGYRVLTDTDQLFTLARYDLEIQASGYETIRYDTIDKVNGLLLSLPALFKNEQYIEAINTYLLGEMERQIEQDAGKVFFLNDEFPDSAFQSIDPEQNFYITADHKLVLSFDEYDIAPGYMGVVTFEIPTEVIADYLVSNLHIK